MIRFPRRKPPEPAWVQPPISRLAWDTLNARVEAMARIFARAYRDDGRPVPAALGVTALHCAADMTEPYGPPAGHPEALSLPEGAADEVMLAGFSLDLWPQDEYEDITADGER